METKPSRRNLLIGVGAATAASALPGSAFAAENASGTAASGDLAYRNAAELIKALAAKQISSVELTDFAIARIEAQDQPINAVVVRDFERARQAAKDLTTLWPAAKRGHCSACR